PLAAGAGWPRLSVGHATTSGRDSGESATTSRPQVDLFAHQCLCDVSLTNCYVRVGHSWSDKGMHRDRIRRLAVVRGISPPPRERLDIVDRLHGHQVADPYRWLEDPVSDHTEEWSAGQDELCRAHLDSLPGRDGLRERLHELVSAGSVSVPVW